MLDTVLGKQIFEDFVNNQPQLIGDNKQLEFWMSFIKFLKEGTNLQISNNIKESIFLNELTTGRNKTKISLIDFRKPKKNKFPKNTNPQTLFFIDVDNEEEQNRYRKNNSFIFGFINDYKQVWRDCSLIDKEIKVFRVDTTKTYKNWDFIKDYLLPLSDIVFIDNYIFDISLKISNLYEIIKKLSLYAASVKFNLTIISYIGNKEDINIEQEYNELKAYLNENNINCNLSIILSNRANKEHDRAIITNYLRIKSGDSFNFFKSSGELATKGTEIEFQTLTESDKYLASNDTLYSIKRMINNLNEKSEKEKYIIGDYKKNKLLFFEDGK